MKVTLPQTLRFEAIDALTPERCALMYGPLLLVALADKDVELRGDRENLDTWISRVPGTPCDFATRDGVRFRPLYLIEGESYTTYCHLRR